MANTGASIEDIKRHTGHKSTKVAEMYIGDSVAHKKRTGNVISSSLSSTSTCTSGSALNESARVMNDHNSHNSHSIIVNVNSIDMRGTSRVTSTSAAYINREIVYKPVNAIQSSSLIDSVMKDDNSHSDIGNINSIDTRSVATEISSSATASNDLLESAPMHLNEASLDIETNGNNVESESTYSSEDNQVQASQVSVSNRNFLSRLEKQFSFYKCGKLTINFK